MTSGRSDSHELATRWCRSCSMVSTWLVRTCRGLMAHCVEAWGIRRDLQTLSKLDDHQLKDIGLLRGEIASIVAHGALHSLAADAAASGVMPTMRRQGASRTS